MQGGVRKGALDGTRKEAPEEEREEQEGIEGSTVGSAAWS